MEWGTGPFLSGGNLIQCSGVPATVIIGYRITREVESPEPAAQQTAETSQYLLMITPARLWQLSPDSSQCFQNLSVCPVSTTVKLETGYAIWACYNSDVIRTCLNRQSQHRCLKVHNTQHFHKRSQYRLLPSSLFTIWDHRACITQMAADGCS